MMVNLTKTIAEHYGTFTDAISGRSERHAQRLVGQFFLGLCAAMFLEGLSDNVINAMITSLSILAGFSFSAMFPIASDAKKDLPEPRYPEDFDDLNRLSKLSGAFRANVAYFIPLTLLCIGTLTIQMFQPRQTTITNAMLAYIAEKSSVAHAAIISIKTYMPNAILLVSIFLFVEALYTFYRMSFTVAFALRIKEEYREGHK